MDRVNMTDVDRPEEVAKVLNKIIDEINKVDGYNKAVEEYNGEKVNPRNGGFVSAKALFVLSIVAVIAFISAVGISEPELLRIGNLGTAQGVYRFLVDPSFPGTIKVAGTATFVGDAVVGDDLTVTDDATIGGDIAVTGTSTLTGAVTATAGVQSAAVTVTATADGLTTGLIPSGTRFVTVTSDSAAKVVVLPASVIGNVVTITVPATGCELQTLATTNETINTVDCDGSNELALVAGSVYQLTCTKAITWVATGASSLGANEDSLTPDADS